MSNLDLLGTVVMKRYGTGEIGKEACEVLSSLEEPSFQLVSVEGESFTWAQSLTRPATPEEAIEYWKARTRYAEDN